MSLPLYWLWPRLTAVFLALWVTVLGAQMLRHCHCRRNVGCPMNPASPGERERALRELKDTTTKY